CRRVTTPLEAPPGRPYASALAAQGRLNQVSARRAGTERTAARNPARATRWVSVAPGQCVGTQIPPVSRVPGLRSVAGETWLRKTAAVVPPSPTGPVSAGCGYHRGRCVVSRLSRAGVRHNGFSPRRWAFAAPEHAL